MPMADRCNRSAFVDREDYNDMPNIACPLPDCDYIWCKSCHGCIEIGGPKHSCDGSSELDHLMKQQGWQYCPSTLLSHPWNVCMLTNCPARLQNPDSEGSWMPPHDGTFAMLHAACAALICAITSASLRAATPIFVIHAGFLLFVLL